MKDLFRGVKNVEKVYSFSTIAEDRFGKKFVKINGRDYVKLGQYQAVTLVGVLFKVDSPSNEPNKYVLQVGLAKQHPSDIVIDKALAYEHAHENALMDPVCVMEVGPDWTQWNFTTFARSYVNSLRLNFVKTAQELKNK